MRSILSSLRPAKDYGIPAKEELKGGLKKIYDESVLPGEKVIVCIEGGVGEALVATDQRVLILKAGFLAGAYRCPLCFAYRYEDIYIFKFGIKRIMWVVPYNATKLKTAVITFTPFQDKGFNGAVNFMSRKVLEVRKKQADLADATPVIEIEGVIEAPEHQ